MRRPHVFDNSSRFLDRFGLLLVVTVFSVVILMLVDIGPRLALASGRWESAMATLLVGSTMLLALRASGLRRHLQLVADAVVVLIVLAVAFLATMATFTDDFIPPARSTPPLVVLLALVAPLAVVRRLAQHREITRSTILGAISGYLLLSIAFFYAFRTWSSMDSDRFFQVPATSTQYMYFSLTTITTTGYGDLTPATNVARLLAMAEAVTGQVYLVTFVAMIVGLFAASWNARRGMAQTPVVSEEAEG